jgi:diguanylate cyclase (GGDEF)-like protein
MVVMRDVSQHGSENDMRRRANYDAITNLPNRTLFLDRLEQAISLLDRSGHTLGLMFIDLDRFKWVNDSLGHAAGDELLTQVGRRLRESVRGTDTVARLSGDEFVVLLHDIHGVDGAERVAAKVLEQFVPPFRLAQHREINVTASMGISLCPDNGKDVYAILNAADTAMYQAKASGRNTFKFFSHEMQQTALFHMQLANDLDKAMANNELHLHYQPMVGLASGDIDDVEALLRWTHPEHGMLDTRMILDIAANANLLARVDDWVLETAVAQAGRWVTEMRPAPRVWVNLSSIRRTKAYEDVLESALRAQPNAQQIRLGVEVTDAQTLHYVAERDSLLAALRDHGVQLALDDFFQSFSSVNDLRQLPIDMIKIDRSMIKTMVDNEGDSSLVASVVDLVHRLGMRAIGEGVETELQLEALRSAGCDGGQGFWFKEAVPANQLRAVIAASQNR